MAELIAVLLGLFCGLLILMIAGATIRIRDLEDELASLEADLQELNDLYSQRCFTTTVN